MQLHVFLLLLVLPKISRAVLEECYDSNSTIRGGGSSFPADFLKHEKSSFQALRSQLGYEVFLDYVRVNSGYGKAQITDQSDADANGGLMLYAATESLLSAQEEATHPNLKTFPAMAGALVLVYNIPGVDDLIISADVLPLMYSGQVVSWSDPLIQRDNPNVTLPDQAIKVIARSDSAGDTQIFTSALSKIDPQWKREYGIFLNPEFVGGVCCSSANWKDGVIYLYATRVIGVVGVVGSVPYSIGYAAMGNVHASGLSIAKLRNLQGVITGPTTTGVQAAIDYFLLQNTDKFTFELNNARSEQAYPLASFSYMIINGSTTPGIVKCEMIELVAFVMHLYGEKQSVYERFGLVKLSDAMINLVTENILRRLTFDDERIYDDYELSIQPIDKLKDIINLILYICIPLGALVILMVVVILYVQYRQRVKARELWILQHSLLGYSGDSRSDSMVNTWMRATYNENPVFVNDQCGLTTSPIRWSRASQRLCSQMRQSTYRSVLDFLGVIFADSEVSLVFEYPAKGTLNFVLEKTPYDLDDQVKFNIANDVIQGLIFLHRSGIVVNYLNSVSCFVDSAWTTKIGNWLHYSLYKNEEPSLIKGYCEMTIKLLSEPERVNQLIYVDLRTVHGVVDQSSDVYSFGLMLVEIFTRKLPFKKEQEENLVQLLQNKFSRFKLDLPDLRRERIPKVITELITLCCGDPKSRPTSKSLGEMIQNNMPSKQGIVDVMMSAMENYMEKLEEMVQQRTGELTNVTSKLEDLLQQVLPPPIASKLYKGEKVEPEFYDNATIFFSDIVGFTKICSKSTPLQVMSLLNNLWQVLDTLIEDYDVYKVDTIGDAYMVASGLPTRNGHDHVRQIALVSLQLLVQCATFKQLPNDQELRMRVGFNSGSVTAGVIGLKMPQYCVFGDAVNIASKMESTGEAMKIQLSHQSYQLLEQFYPSHFEFTLRGEQEIMGRGKVMTYWLNKALVEMD